MFVFLPRGGKGFEEAFCPTFCAFSFFCPFVLQCLTSVCSQNHKSSAHSSSKQRLKDSKD